jgi:hypothetical protein
MNRLSRKDIVKLAARQADPSVSIYLPFTSEPDQQDQNRVRLKNLVAKAQTQLVEEHGWRPPEAEAFMKPAQRLTANGRFQAKPGTGGVAIYLTAGDQISYDLPISFQERVVVGERFYLKPLLPLLARNGRFYILALSLGQVQLLESTQYGVQEVPLGDDVPNSLDEAMQWDDPEQRLQWHSATDSDARRPAAFHGHGVTGQETKKENILRYFQQVDAALKSVLRDEEIPLILAAVDYLLPLYREANSYGLLLDETLNTDPQSLSVQELHKRAWKEILSPYFAQNQAAAAARFNDLAGTDRASADLADLVRAAHDGQIDVLFAAKDQEQWGAFDEAKRRVAVYDSAESGGEELIDLTAVQTLLHGGTVYVMAQEEVPRQQTVAAIFRYPNP